MEDKIYREGKLWMSKDILRCKNCLMPSTRPRISFNESGICNACVWSVEKKSVNWKERENELIKILDKFSNKGSTYDVIVPVSGGKDSCYVSWKLKHHDGLTPLLVYIDPPGVRVAASKKLQNPVLTGYDCLQLAPKP